MSTVKAVSALKSVLEEYERGTAGLSIIAPVVKECSYTVRQHDAALAGALASLAAELEMQVACDDFGYVSDVNTDELIAEARAFADMLEVRRMLRDV
jgi:hypothetical protein